MLALNSYSKLVSAQVLDKNSFCKLVLVPEEAEEEDSILADRLVSIQNSMRESNYNMLRYG